jgi:integrase
MVSQSAQKQLHFSINQFTKSKQGELSFESVAGLNKRLKGICSDLHGLGFEIRKMDSIKRRHVEALVDYWKNKSLSAGTIKNRMSDLRSVCSYYQRGGVVLENSSYGIEQRQYAPKHDKSIDEADFSSIKDRHLKLSLELQQAFGLRREECIKLQPHVADQGDKLVLKGSWTKGGIERAIPILTPKQREVLETAKSWVNKNESMIPSHKSYIQQRRLYDNETRNLGYRNLHGLRHAYAQRRYQEITGHEAPIKTGKQRSDMNSYEKKLDQEARKIISNELGHSRSAITKIYVG